MALYYENKMWSAVGAGVMAHTLGQEVGGVYVPGTGQQGDVVLGARSDSRAQHYDYTYHEGVPSIVEALVPKEHWLHDALLGPNIAVEALYNAYGADAYKHVNDTLTGTIKANADVLRNAITREGQLVDKITKVLDTYGPLDFPLVVLREDPFLASAVDKVLKQSLDKEPVVVSINVTSTSSFLLSRGHQKDVMKFLFADNKMYDNDNGLYIMLPREVTDIAIDTVYQLIQSEFNK